MAESVLRFSGMPPEAYIRQRVDDIFDPAGAKTDGRKFHDICEMYVFTTENIGGYLHLLDAAGKSLLTVSGSGDHLINAAFAGANRITGFDINLLSGFMTDMKLSGLLRMSLPEYEDFFLREGPDGISPNRKAFDYEVYSGLRSVLNPSTSYFFDRLYAWLGNDGSRLREFEIFNNLYDRNTLKLMSNPYLASPDCYARSQEGVAHACLQWYWSPAQEIAGRLNPGDSYDLALLSNLADYTDEMYGEKISLARFTSEVVSPIASRLNPGGRLFAAYVYASSRSERESQYRCEIDNPAERQMILGSAGMGYSEHGFTSVIPGEKDTIIILTKQGGN